MKKRTGCFLTGGLLFLLLLCGGAAAWLYLSSQLQKARAWVQIQSPESGQLTQLNQTLMLDIYAEATRPVLRLEVYADGALVAAANGNNRSLTLVQLWTVTTPGRHALVARAFFSSNDFADSQVVFVDTVDLSNVPIVINVDNLPRGEGVTEIHVGDLAAAAGTTPEEIARLNPSLPAAPEAVISPGTSLRLPRRPIPPPASPPPAVPPPAPGMPGTDPTTPPASRFDGEMHSCSEISLRWTDSPDETGYRLYRAAPGEDLMSLLATLPANTLSYTDTVTRPGVYRYFLAPVRPGGESITSMQSVEIGPECFPAEMGATTSLNLLLLRLGTREAYDGVYCYVSFNGSRYERLPAEPGLLWPADGVYELSWQLPSRGIYSITVPSDGLVRLEGECWGRRGAESLRIGRFSGSHARAEWDGRDLTSDLLAFEPRQLASSQGVPPSTGGVILYRIQPADSRFDLSDVQSVIGSINLPTLLDAIERNNPTIPSPTNLRMDTIGDCEHFPTDDPNIGQVVCAVTNRVSRLRWDWSGNDFYAEGDITGWRVDVSLRNDLLGTETFAYQVSRANASSAGRTAPVPAIPSRYACRTTVRITVTALTDRGESLPSEPLEYTEPPCPAATRVMVTIEGISIRPSARTGEVRDEGDICIFCVDRRLELFLQFRWGLEAGAQLLASGIGACPLGTACLEEGTYIPAPELFEAEGKRVFPLPDGDLVFYAYIDEYDTDRVFRYIEAHPFTIPARSPQEWLRTDEHFSSIWDTGEATIEIFYRVQGIREP